MTTMAGSISINLEALGVSISELQALQNDAALNDALQDISDSLPAQSTGQTAKRAKDYQAGFQALNNSFANLVAQTIAVLSNAEEYFTMTDEELAAYIAVRS